MKIFLTDPVVLICGSVILLGLLGLVWAVGKFGGLKSSSAVAPLDDLMAPEPDARDLTFGAPPAPSFAPAPTRAVSKEVSDRLDTMSQRLAEMQAVLTKQSPGGAGQMGSAPGGVGQGFSPETIDKLLKIIGNVIQQVDILQKNLNPAKTNQAPSTESAITKI